MISGFSIEAEQSQITLQNGDTDTVKVNISKEAGFNESIAFSSNPISGITVVFAPQEVQPSDNFTNLILTAEPLAVPGDYQMIVTGT
ncbi:MAG: hypothetical protein FJY07_02285 [Bacteroidetes bacterium]|nr:hypothetical protein [Bacteroidota bacterium]